MITYDVTWADLEADPHTAFARALSHGSTGWCEPLGAVAVLSHAGCREVLRGSGRFATQKAGSKPHEVIGVSMLTSNDGEHRRLRSPFDPSFRPRVVAEDLRSVVQEELSRLLGELRSTARMAISADLARVLPVAVISRVLGLQVDPVTLRSTYDTFAAALGDYQGDSDDDRARDARRDLEERLRSEVVAASDRGSVLGRLGANHDHGLSHAEIITNSLIVMFGAIETVETLTVNAFASLLANRGAWEAVCANRNLIPAAIDETLRWAPPVGFLGRIATGDQVIDGQEITDGTLVAAVLTAANRDPEVFENPHDFELVRANAADHVSFGYGPHGCMGNSLARLTVATVLDHFARELPALDFEPSRPQELAFGFPFHRPADVFISWA